MQGTQPRQFVQLRANFHSTVEAGGRLNFVQFAVSRPPMAALVLAEIAPRLGDYGRGDGIHLHAAAATRSGGLGVRYN